MADEHKVPESHVDSSPSVSDGGEPVLVSEKEGTSADVQDMARMGKRQETRRNFRHITILGFTMVVLSSWEAILATSVFALGNGGTAGLIWGYFIVMIGFGFVTASLAEMASMAPTSGGQFHWVSELSPRSSQKILSYIVGWLGVLGWQSAAAIVVYLASNQITGLIVLHNIETYQPKPWHGMLIMWAILATCYLFNTFFSRKLPLIEGLIVVLHVAGFFAVIIPLWVMADRSPANDNFTLFTDNAGWNNVPLSTMVGLVGAASCFVGVESGAHMSEEVRNAAYVIPRAMMWTWVGNGLFGWIMAITFSFCVTDIMSVLQSPLGVAYMQVFWNTTGSKAGATVLTVMMLTIAVFACVAVMATNSRQLFSFARDKGLPFSSFFSKVHPRFEIPVNALYVTVGFVTILSFVQLGSATAYMQIVSLGTASMITTYVISISCITLKRLRGEPLLPSKFNLGKFGLAINIVALLFLLVILIFAYFPTSPNPTVETMNWAVMGYGTVIIFAVAYYFVRGRHTYDGPIEYVRKSE